MTPSRLGTLQIIALAASLLFYKTNGLSTQATKCIKNEFRDRIDKLSSASIVDMTPTEVSTKSEKYANVKASGANCITNTKPLRQQLFTSPLISTLYERVLPPLWSAGLRIGGPDEEYKSAASFLIGNGNSIALDMSCGTGFVGRRFASSGLFEQVFALDYSEQMLNECVASIQRENEFDSPIVIVRGDAGSLPFNDNSFDCVHWGAAMHCVPDAEAALSELYRVLKPGGRAYVTTFLRPFPDIVFRFFTVAEIEKIAKDAGFTSENFNVEGKGVYGILRASK